MTDLEDRAARVAAVAEDNYGSVLGRDGDVMIIEVPVDIAPGLGAIWGAGGFSCIFQGQRTRLSHCRVIDMNGHTIVSHQMVTTVFYRFAIDLTVDTRAGKAQPGPAEITMPTPPKGSRAERIKK